MNKLRTYKTDIFAILLLLGLSLCWFAPVLVPSVTGKSLLPYDNLYGFEPWRSLKPGIVPHNNLLSDLVLENAAWKLHIARTLQEGDVVPLWNPQIFTGLPFLAAGQASTFYPLSLLFYILPLDAAYGWFTALQIALAGINTYLFGRVLGLRRPAALLSGVIFMFSGFLIVSVVFTMFVAAVVWLPLLLAIIELIIQKQEAKGLRNYSPIPYVAAGVLVLGLVVLAGHPELIYYTLLVSAAYSLFRLLTAWRAIVRRQSESDMSAITRTSASSITPSPSHLVTLSPCLRISAWLLAMVVLGVALGGMQLVPMLELLPLNFRQGSATLQQVVGWAWPVRHVFTFFLPDLFGNPSHHAWFDIWQRQWVSATVNAHGEAINTIFWGIKNYVEGGNYLGVAAWLLAGVAILDFGFWILDWICRSPKSKIQNRSTEAHERPKSKIPYTFFFSLLALISLLFAFGTPIYALLFYGLPGWNQLHSPFRWVFPFTLSMAMLAGIGLERIAEYSRSGGGSRASPNDSQSPIYPDRQDRRLLPTQHDRQDRRLQTAATVGLAWLAMLVGAATLLVVLGSLVVPDFFIGIGQRLVDGSDLAQNAFADGRMFWGYQSIGLVRFGVFSLLSGLLLNTWTRHQRLPATRPSPLAPLWLALIVCDLYSVHGHFNPAADVTLFPLNPANIPPAIQFLNQREGIDLATRHPPPATRHSPWRFTTFNLPDDKTFQANLGMYYGWHDIRGYDSVIPSQYVQLLNRIAPQANSLLYNQIAPLRADSGSNYTSDPYAVLDNPLLDLLNIKYILSEHTIPNPSWQEIYRDDAIGIYENRQVFGRALIVPEAKVMAADTQPLLESDLQQTLFIEDAPAQPSALIAASPQLKTATISRYRANEVFIDVNLSDRGWLLLTDAWFPGWKAYKRPFGAGENTEEELQIQRADGAFRTVYLPQSGQWTVRFVYSPMSFKLGLYISFLALMSVVLLAGYWAWGRYYRPESTVGEVRTVAKNALAPLIMSLTNKAIDFAYAMLYVRLLGKEDTGSYYFVVAVYGVFEIISRYGLGTLLTRDVAEDKNRSSRYLTNVIALRTLLWLISLPLLALVIFMYWVIGGNSYSLTLFGYTLINSQSLQGMGKQEIQALALLALSMLFSNWADALSSTFSAFEKMEYPAGLSSAASMIKVTLGALLLLLGWGFIGLALVSVIINLVQLLWLYSLLRRTLFQPEVQWDSSLQGWMLRNSGHLMVNHLLATFFWRIDVWILKPLAGAASVGIYSIGLRYLDGLNIIPSLFTMAVFPLMSRYAKRQGIINSSGVTGGTNGGGSGGENGGGDLLRAYVLCLRLLVITALPIAMTVTFWARPMVSLVGGSEFLDLPEKFVFLGRQWSYIGGSDLALRVIIWSIPIGFVNSITQFLLISVNQQRYLTRAFVIGVLCNVVGNLLFIPSGGYIAAALTTILSELVLLIPFYRCVRQHVGVVPWLTIFLPAILSVVLMGLAAYALILVGINLLLAVLLSWLVYAIALVLTGAVQRDELVLLTSRLPRFPVAWPLS